MATKTKNELMEETDPMNEEIKALYSEVKRLEKYKAYDQSSEELKALMDSYIRAGFSEEQAFALQQLVLFASMPKTNNTNFFLERR